MSEKQDNKEKIRIATLVAKAFEFLSANYSYAWSRSVESSSYKARTDIWSYSMRGLSMEQFEHAKRKILDGECYLEFPPTPAQFRLLCRSMSDKPIDVQESRFDPNYDPIWYKSLEPSQKAIVYEGALIAYPFLEKLLQHCQESFLDENFEKSVWFKPMIESFKESHRIWGLNGLKIESLGVKF